MSDVPPRPRIRPATSDDWHKDQTDRASLTPSPGQESTQSAADFDNSTYYEYLEKHTGDVPVSKNRTRNVFAPAGASPFQAQNPPAAPQTERPGHTGTRGQTGARGQAGTRGQSGARGQAQGRGPKDGQPGHAEHGPGGPASGQIPLQPTPAPKKRNGAKITVVIIAIIIILGLLAFFGIRSLAPSMGTVPVDFGGEETPSASPSPSESLVQPTESPQQALSTYTKQGTAKADDLEGQWVTQVSAKDIGLEADGKTWTAQDILDEFETNRVKYPGAILIHSGDWGSYKDDNYWVTIINTPYSDAEPALDQCRSWGLDRDHCIAKRLVKDGNPQNNSEYLDK